jgi:hypothetical protein
LFAGRFPEFIKADRDAEPLIGPVRERFDAFHIVMVDGDIPVAAGWGVPICWNGNVSDLPSGYSDTLRRALDADDKRRTSDTFVICGGVVHPERSGSGLASDLIRSLGQTAQAAGLERLIAPLRPTLKHRYPLTDIDTYTAWTRPDGLPFDPWIRLHIRLGATVVATAPRSQVMQGSVNEWEEWTGMTFPASGAYVIPEGLSILNIDHERNIGEYVEPNVWVRHK